MGPYAPDIAVYAPSRLRACKTISEQEFLNRYADHGQAARVSIDGGEPTMTTVYGYGLDAWYIVL